MKSHSKTLWNGAVLALTLFLCTIVFLIPYFTDNAENCALPDREFDDSGGERFATVELADLADLGVVSYVNHTPGKYLAPKDIYTFSDNGEPTKIDDLKPSEYGTLRFCIMNLDPKDETFETQKERLKQLFDAPADIITVSFRLSFLCSAATVYVNSAFEDSVGSMENYVLNDYVDPAIFPNVTLPKNGEMRTVTVNREISLQRKTLDPSRLRSATYITIHYQTKAGASDGVIEKPLIGTEVAVSNAAVSQRNAVFPVVCVSALLLFSFTVLMLLKRNFSLIGQILSLLAVFLIALGAFIPFGTFTAVALPTVLKAIAVSLFLFSALFSVRPNRRFKIPYCTALCVGAVNVLLSAVLQGIGALRSFAPYAIVSSVVLTAAVAFFGVFDFLKNKNGLRLSVPLVGCFVAISAYATAVQPLATFTPVLWVSVLVILSAFLFIGGEFLLTERKNRYLTDNLKAEVDAQTASLKTAVEDKNRLLSFISHDLRKPTVAVADSLANLDTAALGDNGKKSVREMLAKMTAMKESFYEISTYAKDNSAGESFAAFDFVPFCENLLENLRPDCTAAGIDLICKLPKKLTVYAKSRALTSALENIVLNATEHAACSEIAVTASKKSGFVKVTVADNGKGLDSAVNVFSPYVGTAKGDNNLGLGLFIAKSHIESMGGKISFETSPLGTTFTLTLLSDVG